MNREKENNGIVLSTCHPSTSQLMVESFKYSPVTFFPSLPLLWDSEVKVYSTQDFLQLKCGAHYLFYIHFKIYTHQKVQYISDIVSNSLEVL